ncbi:collagenase-like protein with putative collagen-binding domain [Neolewinella xylanilytica]|uniref:Collagenase-like protein with putative collagen-binding domain n=1 Tax=Neolewinella xylanilytica TaxID=1514080 RepID=A0A2S6I184_9BACT|nr:DUF4038 domain-containing protein [Neolewinella xylanilytica]PPK84706.1 collagenase-like protein with putative collagen-binding domain [Neolewinella xylanilytica]
MRIASITCLILAIASAATGTLSAQTGLGISKSGTHLERTTGEPFFYLGDTAWELLHRSTEDEARNYLEDRAEKGFNVIQTVVLAELEGLTVPNSYGDLPLQELDPTRWNEAYFTYVDRVAKMADSLGIFLGLLPTWGDKFNKKWGVGPEIFTPANARTYGRMLGERYGDHNVIWILGGDRNPENPEDLAIVRAMAAGLREAVGDRQLITYHPQGSGRSSDFFAGEDWIDFHLFQSGHGRREDKQNYDFPPRVRAADPGKPVINGEPLYEDHPINWRPANGWFDDFDARQAAWWSVLSGTAGHTFGNHNIWQMWLPGRDPISHSRTPWPEALDYPGAAQIGHLGRLMQSLPYYDLRPDPDLLRDAPNSSGREVVLARNEDYSLLIAYTPYGDVLRLPAGRIGDGAVTEWFNPRSGETISITPESVGDAYVYDPPFEPARGNDWVLVIQYDAVSRQR